MTQKPKTDLSAPTLFDQLRHHQDLQSEPATSDTSDGYPPLTAPPTSTDLEAQEATDTPETVAVPEKIGNGRLPPEARRALVNLLRQGVIMADNKRVLFETLCRYETLIQDHLADIYMRLLIDQKAGLALILQQEITGDDSDDDDVTSLISRRTLSLYDTLLLLVLRKHYQEREAAGAQRVFIDIDRIEAQLTPFLPLTNSSRSDRRYLNGTLQTMKDRRVLAAVRGDDERFEITPVIRYVVNAVFLQEMLNAYQTLIEQTGQSECGGPKDD